jgi:hypothetical protein
MLVAASHLVLVAAVAAATTEDVKLVASNAAAVEYFGYDVAISGGWLLVGKPIRPAIEGPGGYPIDGGPGSAYFIRHGGTGWIEEQEVVASDGDPAVSNEFARAVAIDGDVAVIAAHKHIESGIRTGAAYVFRRVGGVWQEEAKLLASDAHYGQRFGASVAVDGGVIVVGAPADVSSSAEAGVYVFRFDGSDWIEETKVMPANPGALYFGIAVSLDGNALAVGANYTRAADGTTFRAGTAYVFRHDGSGWQEEAELRASDQALDRFFGQAVALEADTLLVGAPGTVAEGPGRAYVFRHAGGDWSEETILSPTDGATQGSFGLAVELRGDTAIVGPTASRTVLVFEHDAGTWSPIDELAPSSGYNIDFGTAIAISPAGESAVATIVGARRDASVALSNGAVFVYGAPAAEPPPAPAVPGGLGPLLLAPALGLVGAATLRRRTGRAPRPQAEARI